MSRTGFSRSVTTLACFCFFVAGCAPSLEGNEPREPHKEIPQSFGVSSSTSNATPEPASTTQTVWRDFFDDAELEALIELALDKNQELNIQLQEIIIARNEVSARQGDYLPKVGVGAGAGVERAGKNTSRGISDESHGLPENLGDFTFGLWGSWEVDVWGKLRNATKSADFRYLATIEGRNFMVTQIVAEIARSYFELVAIDNQLDVLKRNIEILGDALVIIRLEKEAARVTELAVQRFEAEVLKNKSRLYDLEQQKIQTENRINFLVGRYPQTVSRNAQKLTDPLPKVASGPPSDLLKNRPDIRQAELELSAAKLDVKVAKAEFYPSLSIDAAVGYRSFNIKHLLVTPDSLIYNLAGNLTAPLLNRKAIEAQYRSANARQLQAVFNYERTLLQAFTDVANQLASIDNLQKAYELQLQQVEALTRSSEVSTVLFQSARADYMEVLLTRRDSLDAKMELIETRKRQWLAVINLYQALGGGWRSGASKAAR
ncbi:TolC family protein [Polyangium sp. y55x31]|uniref:TolC family protein n=1 Tax=Polyangium sp. y55x31 TaxID=3042688 RepID=UPI0024829400|nr:TolC family protein [Polyangium sp. y55x31]MDI1480843.1 TolC family protein [Polyangium sp. y55x31]